MNKPLLAGIRRCVLGVHWKDWCWSWSSNILTIWCGELTHLKRPWCWKRLKAGGEGTTEDENVGWHQWLDGHGFGWIPGVADGQGGLECCSSWGCKDSDPTEQLNWTELNLLFGSQGRSRRLKPFPLNKKKGTQRSFYTQEGSSGSCSVSVPPFLWYFSIMGITWLGQERE